MGSETVHSKLETVKRKVITIIHCNSCMCCDYVILVCDEVMCQGIVFVLSVHIIWAYYVCMGVCMCVVSCECSCCVHVRAVWEEVDSCRELGPVSLLKSIVLLCITLPCT